MCSFLATYKREGSSRLIPILLSLGKELDEYLIRNSQATLLYPFWIPYHFDQQQASQVFARQALIFFPLPPITNKKFTNVSAKLLLGKQAQGLPPCCWGSPSTTASSLHPQNPKSNYKRLGGMPPLCPLQMAESCLGNSQDGCWGTAIAPVLPTTTKSFRTRALGWHHGQWAPWCGSIWRRHFI